MRCTAPKSQLRLHEGRRRSSPQHEAPKYQLRLHAKLLRATADAGQVARRPPLACSSCWALPAKAGRAASKSIHGFLHRTGGAVHSTRTSCGPCSSCWALPAKVGRAASKSILPWDSESAPPLGLVRSNRSDPRGSRHLLPVGGLSCAWHSDQASRLISARPPWPHKRPPRFAKTAKRTRPTETCRHS